MNPAPIAVFEPTAQIGSLILVVAYAVVGPALTITLTILLYFGRRRMTRLHRTLVASDLDGGSSVVACVPVRNEEAQVASCIESLLAPSAGSQCLRVVVMSDRSTDGTDAVLVTLREAHPDRLAVDRISTLPIGWLGKPHALHEAVARHVRADVDWLLFVDSDVRVDPDTLRRVLHLAQDRDYAAVSLLTGIETPTWLERLVTPVAASTWMATFRASDTNRDAHPDRAVANGQYMLVRPRVLAEAGGHEAVRDQTCEDVALFRRFKAAGHRVRLLVGTDLVRTRMHATWSEMINGWARNFAGTARHDPRPILVAMAVVGLQCLPLPMVAASVWLEIPGLAVIAVIHTIATGVLTWRACRMAGLPTSHAVLPTVVQPLPFLLVLPLLANAVRACFGGRVRWRGNLVRA